MKFSGDEGKIQMIIGTIFVLAGLLIIAINPSISALQISLGSFLLVACVGIFLFKGESLKFNISSILFSIGLALTVYNYFENPQIFDHFSPFLIIGGISWFFLFCGPLSAISINILIEDDNWLLAVESLIGDILISAGTIILILNWGFDAYMIFIGVLFIIVGIIFIMVIIYKVREY